MKAVINILKEQVENFYLIKRLSIYEMKSKNASNILGSYWEIINLLIQLAVYWFVFANIRESSGIALSNGEEAPFFFWLLAGFVLWMFFFKATIEGSSSIYSRIRMLSKMSFPMSIVPSFVIFSYLYVHLIMLGITVLIFNVGGFYISVYYLQFLYFIPATIFLLFGIGLIMSTLSTLLRDVHMLLNAFLKMLLYLSPILWEIGNIGGVIGIIAKLNPLYYLIEGYRAALFGTEWYFINHWEYSIYFWVLSLTLFLIGARLHIKFRRHLIDFA